jgi:CheY-like chemotaxis protein
MTPTVLVVGGDAQVRRTAAGIIEEAELSCVEAASAEDALAYLREHAPDIQLIFTDFELPDRLDGIDLARVAALRWPWIKAVVITGGPRLRDVPSNVIFLPKVWGAADLREQLRWVPFSLEASKRQEQGRTAA